MSLRTCSLNLLREVLEKKQCSLICIFLYVGGHQNCNIQFGRHTLLQILPSAC